MQSSKYTLARVILISIVALFIWLLTPYAAPALAQDRVFLDLSLDFLGEYKLPKTDFMDTPVGGLSAVTYDRRRDRFYAVSDDPSVLAPARFYTFKIAFNSPATEKIEIQKVDIESVKFLTNKDGQTFAKQSITPKGIAITPEQTVFISGYSATGNSFAPFVQEFDINGKMLQSLPIPQRYVAKAVDENKSLDIQQTSAFESLTFNPTGNIPTSGEPVNLFTATSRALVQDQEPYSSDRGAKSRFLHYLIGYGSPVLLAEYLYPLAPTSSSATSNSLVELLSVDLGGHFLSLERSKEQSGFNEKIFQIATGGATDTSRIDSLKGEIKGVRPIKKKLLLDLKDLGIPLDNLQGMTLGPRLRDGTQSLLLVSDNNFDEQQATQFLLFRLNRSKTSSE